ncbi:MAG: sigma-54-dependent transcriptional regulator [Pirellulaceae bacterium]
MTSLLETYDSAKVLVVDDHARARQSMADILTCASHEVACCASAVEAIRKLDEASFDVIITDLKMPGMSGLEFIRALEQRSEEAQILMVTAHASVTTAVEAMRHGAFDYIEKPFTADQLESLVDRAVCRGKELHPRATLLAEAMGATMIGSSPAMQALSNSIQRVASTTETVLITGESGVGKELVARSIHVASNRARKPLISLNCPVLSPQLMESELFGHVRGAFTSAEAPRVGRFELADGGTILLDEVTEISLPLQAKLLRVLQERNFERVGSSETCHVDVRVLATSNRDLHQEVTEQRFREDLYFRLAVVPIHVPSLRQRRDDVLPLVDHFLRCTARRLGTEPCQLENAARDLLVHYHWPGNVRELENIVTRASVLGTENQVSADTLRSWLIDPAGTENDDHESSGPSVPAGMNLQQMERRLIEATLEQFDGHRAETARALGIGVRTLTNKLRAYGYAPRAKVTSRAA